MLLDAFGVRFILALCGNFLNLYKLMLADIGVGYLNVLGNDLLAVGAVNIAKSVLLKGGLNGYLLFGVDMIIRVDGAVLKAAGITHGLAGAICLAAGVAVAVCGIAAFFAVHNAGAFLSMVFNAVAFKSCPR